MPFRGRPSRGCETCRRRKIKCDLRETGCEKCEKAGWKCEGYRDLTSLMFHDESDRIIKKVNAQKGTRHRVEHGQASSSSRSTTATTGSTTTSSTTASSPSIGTSELICEALDLDSPQDSAVQLSRHNGAACTPSSSPPQGPPFSTLAGLDDIALARFFERYVFKYHDKRDQWDIEVGNGCLLAAVKALGTADAVKEMGRGRCLEAEAQKHYVDAIQKINSALQSPLDRARDSTLLAITILGVFESVSGFQRNLDSWREHVNGAASLLQLRGTEQFKTQTGCRLFLQTCLNLIMSCLSRRLPIPAHVRAMQKEAEKFIPDPTESVWRFHLASLKIADLNARLLPGNYPVSSNHAQLIVDDALALYAELESILEDAPEDWRPHYVGGTSQLIYSGYYCVFDSYIIAQIFCGNWSYRIMLTDILRKALINLKTSGKKVIPEQLEQIQFYMSSVRQLQLSILAVIPQHLSDKFAIFHTPDSEGGRGDRLVLFQNRDHNPFRAAERDPGLLPFVRMSGGYQTQFPLFTAGAADPPGGPIRTWVIGVLRLLHLRMGVQQAAILATQLEEGNDSGSGIPEDMWHCCLPP
ncbi:Putative zn(2)-C6 fungal-type DNA-binding domain, fungal transcription factor [Septoria linicola]|uniref:Zn(2)-C6 fungal-type DNA-binding domain, fungal transcription factor n=1 Tax=Septoria linicola TaxID=215465 RepID=A0A9Q9AVB1_9PEZI|nr:Putative zn(2)-C6 fungal-type DNA-binding domain, fungal transcription factor [Septoria linicola]